MIETITAMLSNPQESTYVVEGALFAVSSMPVGVIYKNLQAILPWTKDKDWWFREASFMALQGLEPDPDLYIKVVPTLTEMLVAEDHTMPRLRMDNKLAGALKNYGPDSEVGQLLVNGFEKVVTETRVLEGRRGREAKYHINDAIEQIGRTTPGVVPQVTELFVERGLYPLDDDELLVLINGGRSFKGLLNISKKLKDDDRKDFADLLYNSVRPEVAKRLKAGGGKDITFIDTVIALNELGGKTGGWKPIGSPQCDKRTWYYLSFDPTVKKDILPRRVGRRYREIDLPPALEGWYKPEFDASKWKSGYAPIGKGGHPRGPRTPVKYPSDWGDGEILLARTTFELETTDFEMIRLKTLCGNGFIVYLNGKKIKTYSWWSGQGDFRNWPLGERQAALLKKGTNTLAVYALSIYPSEMKAHWKQKVFGEMDCYIESLSKEDLY